MKTLRRLLREQQSRHGRNMIFLELFGGAGRLGSQWSRRSWGSINFELSHGPWFDVTRRPVLELIVGWISSGIVAGAWLGTPCSSWSRARRGFPGSPGGPLRTRTHIYGIPGLNAVDKQKVIIGNHTMRASARIIRCCLDHHVPVGLENPAGSFLRQAPPIALLAQHAAARNHCFDMCAFGCRWRKRTRVVLWHAHDVPRLRACCRGRRGKCSFTQRPHIILQGYDGNGHLWTKRAEVYPQCLANLLANTLAAASDMQHLNKLCQLCVGQRP